MPEPKIITPLATPPPPQIPLAAAPPEPTRMGQNPNTAGTPQQPISSIPATQTLAQPQITLGETGEHGTNLSKTDQFLLRTNWSWSKIMAVLMAAQGLYGLYISVHFILIDYPVLEAQLAAHAVSQTEVNTFASQAIIIVVSTLISMVFAIRLSIVKKAAKILQKVLTGVLFVANTAVMHYLNEIGSAEIVNRYTKLLIDFIRHIF